MTRFIRNWALFAAAAVAVASPKQKLAPDLPPANTGSVVDVIIQYNNPPQQQQHDKVAQKGGMLKADLGIANSAAYSVPASQLKSVSEDPDVVYISPDRPVQRMMDVTAPSVNAEIAWQYGWNGKGIGVAIIDSGIADSPDLHDPATGKTRVVYTSSR